MMVYNIPIKYFLGEKMTVVFSILAILAIILLITCYTFSVTFHSPRNKHNTLDEPLHGEQYEAVSDHIFRAAHIMEKYPCEEVWITSFDGTRLFGRYYHNRDGAPLKILFHGYRSCAYRDCSGGHSLSRKLGFNALVVDQRAHGKSDGTTICFGVKEHRDCLCWIKYANARFGTDIPIILSGLSMGAATVLMATGLPLPENVVCVIADSPYSAPSAIIEKVCQDNHYPVAICRPFFHLGAWLFGGFRLNSCTAKDAVSRSTVPILLIHGEDDRLVPCTMSHEIADCCASPVAVHTFPESGHGLCYIIDPLRYERIICAFLMTIPELSNRISEDFIRSLFEK